MTRGTAYRPMWTVLASGLVWLLAACMLSGVGAFAAPGDLAAHAPAQQRTF